MTTRRTSQKGRKKESATLLDITPLRVPPAVDTTATGGAGPVENGKRLATFQRGMSEEMRVNWSEYNGHHFVGLRVWHCGMDGIWRPDRVRGCTIKLRELADFSAAIQAAVDMATDHG